MKSAILGHNDMDEHITLSKTGDVAAIKELLRSGLLIDTRDAHGFTMLLESAEFGHSDLFWFLVERGADPRVSTVDGFTLVHAVAIGGTVHMLKYAIRSGCDVYAPVRSGEQAGFTALDYAIVGNNRPVRAAIETVIGAGPRPRDRARHVVSNLHSGDEHEI